MKVDTLQPETMEDWEQVFAYWREYLRSSDLGAKRTEMVDWCSRTMKVVRYSNSMYELILEPDHDAEWIMCDPYIKANPHVEYAISDEGRIAFAHDDDAVHCLLSCGGKAR
jgi:hypothetical protein